MGDLRTEPVAVGKSEETAQAKVSIRSDSAFACHNIANPLRRYADLPGEAIARNAYRDEKLLQKQFSGGDWGKLFYNSSPQR